MKPTTNTLVTTYKDQDSLMGAQLTEQYRKAVGALKEVLIFGAMLLTVDQNCSARGTVSGGRGKTGGLREWLREYAPDIPVTTAWRFKALAEGLRDEFRLGAKVDLHHVLTAPEEDLDAKLVAKRVRIEEFIEGKSQRQLLFELGGSSSSHGTRPVGNPLQQPEPSHEEQQRMCEERCRAENVEFFNLLLKMSDGDKWQVSLSDHELEVARDAASTLAKRITEWLRLPQSKRPLPDAARELMRG